MVNIIENWTLVIGVIESITESAIEGHKNILMKVINTKTYRDYPDLLAGKKEINAALKQEAADEHQLKNGMQLTCLMRVAKNAVFIKPDSIKT
jgi:hypothetical protein